MRYTLSKLHEVFWMYGSQINKKITFPDAMSPFFC